MSASATADRQQATTVQRAVRASITPLLLLLCGWAAFNWFQTIHRIIRYYVPAPDWDYWRVGAYLHFYQAFDFRVLWRQHNEHRIVFPEIVFAADALLFRGREWAPLVVTFFSYFASWVVLAGTFWREQTISPGVRKAGILLAAVIIGWQGSAAVLANAFLLQWTLTQIAVLLSLACLCGVAETRRDRYLTGAILSAVVATYSSGNGMLLWPILLAIALLLSLSRRQITTLAIAAVLSIGVYFVGYRFTGTLHLGSLIKHPIYSLEFVASYLSMPFGGMKSSGFGVGIGLINLCTVSVLSFVAARNRGFHRSAAVLLFGSYAFTLLTALLTAAARMNPADSGFAAAKAPRYLTFPLFAWGVFTLLCVWFSSRPRVKWPLAATLSVITLLFLIAPVKLRWWMHARDIEYANAQLASLALEQDVYDSSLMLGVFPDPISARVWSVGLRDSHLSVFSDGFNAWLGRPVREFGRTLNETVTGTVTSVFPVISGFEIVGWADESQAKGVTGRVLFTNENGEIVGYGRKLAAGFPPALISPVTPPSLGWVGFVHLNLPVKSFSTYLVHKRGLAKLEGATPVPRERAVSSDELGPAIGGIEWQMDRTWTPNLVPQVNFGPAPDGGFYGSWTGNDANIGQITSSAFTVPENRCLILPLLNGPVANNVSAEIIDAGTNQVIATAPFQNGARWWMFWRVSIPESIKRVRVFAEDRGRGWGEWGAIGQPHRCR